MTRTFRLILAASFAVAALAGVPAHGQSSRAIVTFNDPNCASWGVTQSGSNFTLTCQALMCTLTADKPAPLPTENVVLTAACVGFSGSTYTWSKFSGPAGCPLIASTTATANLAAPGGSEVSGCVYKVSATDPVNGAGSATITLNWSSALPVSPTGCSVAFTTGSPILPSAGGAVTMVATCSANTNGATAWAWTKNAVPFGSGTTMNDSLPANTGTSTVTTTYGVTATNAGAPATTVTQTVAVTGTGGGSGIDTSACTAAGFTGHGVDMPYPLVANLRVLTSNLGNFGNSDAVVVHFKTPASDPTGGGHFIIVNAGGAPYVFRLATLDTKPCSFGTAGSNVIPAVIKNLAPSFNLNIAPLGGGFSGQIQLQPLTDYYFTIVNRNDYYGLPTSTPSCTAGTCDAYVDSN